MKWTDAEDIGIALAEKFPGVDPLTDPLHRPAREGGRRSTASTTIPKMSNEPKLEAIQMAWHEELEGRAVSLRRHVPAGHARLLRAAHRRRGADRQRVPAVGDRRRRRRSPACPTSRRCGWPASAPLAAVLAMLSLITRRNSRHPLLHHRPRRARHHVPVVAHHAAHGGRARADDGAGVRDRRRHAGDWLPPVAVVGHRHLPGARRRRCPGGFRHDHRRQARRPRSTSSRRRTTTCSWDRIR